MILTFEDKMSGIRVNLPTDLNIETTMAWINYNAVPEWVHTDLWFMVDGMDLSILKRENGKFDMKPTTYIGNAVGEIKDTRVSEKILEDCWASISMDDQIKIWIFNNRKDLWQELLDKFKSVKNIWNYYLRFNH